MATSKKTAKTAKELSPERLKARKAAQDAIAKRHENLPREGGQFAMKGGKLTQTDKPKADDKSGDAKASAGTDKAAGTASTAQE